MKEYMSYNKDEYGISVCFYASNEKVQNIGEQINAINEEAYMNGYNWAAFLTYYLENKQSDLLIGMDADPEADMFVAYYEGTLENEEKAKRLIAVIEELIEHPQNILDYITDYGDEIEWD